MNSKTAVRLRRLRRVSQATFFALFIWFILRTCYSGAVIDLGADELSVPAPLNHLFAFDPLITLGHLISTHTFYPGFWLSVAVLAVTALIGRVFCGWVCPFGTLHHFCSRLQRHGKRGRKNRVERGRYSRAQRIKYYILAFLLVAAALSNLQVGVIDPLCLFSRSFILSVFPAANFVVKNTLVRAMDSPLPILPSLGNSAYDFLSSREIIGPHVFYDWSLLTGLILLSLLAADIVYTRFWCRFICPLGALFAIFSRFSLVKMKKENVRCTWCGDCMILCQGGSSPEGGATWRAPECHLCLNCQADCPEDVMQFGLLGPRQPEHYAPDLARRGLIASVAAGLLAVPLLRMGRGRVNRSRLLRPPGSIQEGDYLATCLRCGSCSRICPTGAIHPTLMEAGLEGLWTPRIVPRIGYCVYSCTLCGQVCPSGAIRRLTVAEKEGSGGQPPVKIGTAAVSRERCLAWGSGVPCGACEEVCPVSPKAITLDETELKDSDGETLRLGRPLVNTLLCVGCGRCENICPVEGAAAIRVFSTGETRAAV